MGDNEQNNEKRKRMSAGLYFSCPAQIKEAVQCIFQYGYHFCITQIVHPNFDRNLRQPNAPLAISRTDRILKGSEWSRLVVAELSPSINVDSEVPHISANSKAILEQELGFASHLGIPAVLIKLKQPINTQLAGIIYDKVVAGFMFSTWVQIPMVHPSRYSPISDVKYDTWEWWNDFRTYCHYEKRVGVVLELPDVNHVPSKHEVDRWIGEPVKALIIPTTVFIYNQHGKPVLSKSHQEIIQKFMNIDVQYIIKSALESDEDLSLYVKYLNFLGKKLYLADTMTEFVQGCEDFLQNPLQPLAESLEAHVYEVFEKDRIKYDTYQDAIYKAVEDFKGQTRPVVMVLGAGRGPLVQAVINVSCLLDKEIKIYAVEKNPYAFNTLIDRNENEWHGRVTLVHQDMRTFEPPEKADIMVSELLGSFGDNELSPECLDGAQRFLQKGSGISIPRSYTSFLAPLQSLKIFNEIRNTRQLDKTLINSYETPYVVHLANYYQLAPAQELFKFTHPNWSEVTSNERYKKLKFRCGQATVLTGFVGFFETVLYDNIMLSINPQTHTPDMVSWFPIVFSLQEPVQLKEGSTVEVSFWRSESPDKVWYSWCLESPVKTSIMNPSGRSYFIKKH